MPRAISSLLSACVIFAFSVTAAKAEPEVFVTNGPNKPVPVTVTGETTGTITGDVNVTNDENSPVPVTVQENKPEYVRERFLVELFPGIADDQSEDYTVPDGKRLFIDSVACQASPLSDQELTRIRLQSFSPSANVLIPLVNIQSGIPAPGIARGVVSYQLTSNVLDGGETIRMLIGRNNINVRVVAGCYMSGRLVDLE